MCRGVLDGSEEYDQELGVFTPWTQVPGGQEQLGLQPDFAGVGQERRELVVTVGPETDDDPSLSMNVISEASQHLDASTRRKERHHVSGTDDGIEALEDAAGRQVKLRQVLDDPAWARMILDRGLDQYRIDVDADHVMPESGQFGSHAPRAAARVEDAGPTRHHRVDHTGLASQVTTGRCHRMQALDVPRRVVRVRRNLPHPRALFHHVCIVPSGALPLASDLRRSYASSSSCGPAFK